MGKYVASFVKTNRDFLRIGVSGHRILTELDRIRAGIDHAVRKILKITGDRQLNVVSSLAEGADRLVVEQIIKFAGSRLTAVLPMPREIYVRDFSSPVSVREFAALLSKADEVVELPASSAVENCYEAAGAYVLGHCDLLFAVWDGLQAQGIGGTGTVVTKAREHHLPLAWIHAGNRLPGGNTPTSLGLHQGTVSFERLSAIQRTELGPDRESD
jgi:hypothetical protein